MREVLKKKQHEQETSSAERWKESQLKEGCFFFHSVIRRLQPRVGPPERPLEAQPWALLFSLTKS